MRPDMERVVTERPRRDHKNKYHGTGLRSKFKRDNGEDAATFGSTARHRQFGYEAKEFSDLIQPLYRFFRSNIGKNWDKVWSSVCEHLPAKTLSAYHIRKQHLERMIEVTPLYVDGKYYSNDYSYRWRRDGQYLVPFYKNDFYVDKEGCIREGKGDRRSYRRNKKEEPVTSFDKDGQHYYKTNGCWFLAKSRVVERRQWKSYTPKLEQRSWGMMVRPAEGMPQGYMPGPNDPEGEYITVTETVWLPAKQLNTKELLALGLQNDRQ